MEIDLSNSKDLLFVSLAVGFLMISISLTFVLVRVFRVLGRVNSISETVDEITHLVNHYLWQPAKITKKIVDRVKKAAKKKK